MVRLKTLLVFKQQKWSCHDLTASTVPDYGRGCLDGIGATRIRQLGGCVYTFVFISLSKAGDIH